MKELETTDLDDLHLAELGHSQSFQRQFSRWTMLGLAFAILNSWTALAASLSLSVLPSPPGIAVLLKVAMHPPARHNTPLKMESSKNLSYLANRAPLMGGPMRTDTDATAMPIPMRLAILRLLNDIGPRCTYEETLRITAEFRQSCQSCRTFARTIGACCLPESFAACAADLIMRHLGQCGLFGFEGEAFGDEGFYRRV